MRLWHKALIPVLPRQQLLGQWRECCAIMKSITETGMPNHILVSKIMEYPLTHFFTYAYMVANEMQRRGYAPNRRAFSKYMREGTVVADAPSFDRMFAGWHNDRYLRQCFYNLQEKYDCGAISDEEWNAVAVKVVALYGKVVDN